MKVIVLILSLITFVSCATYKCRFVITATDIKYSFDGHAYVTIAFEDILLMIDNFHPQGSFDIPINGTFTNDKDKKYPASGMTSILEPYIQNLDKIKVTGKVEDEQGLIFNGVFKVKILDVLKQKIPVNGEMTFSDGRKSKATGYVERPNIIL